MLWVAVFALYRWIGRPLVNSDVYATLLGPWSLFEHGVMDLRPYPIFSQGAGYGTLPQGERLVPFFPIWPGFNALPVLIAGWLGGRNPAGELLPLQRLAAQLQMATTVALVAATLRREHGSRAAWLGGIGFALGTCNVFLLSHLFFTNGVAEFWLALALWAGYRREGPSRFLAGLAAFSAVAMAFARLPTAPMAVVLLAWLGVRRKHPRTMGIAAVATTLLMAGGNVAWTGHPLGGYGYAASYGAVEGVATVALTQPTFWVALYANAFSPGRGLFLFSPWLLLAFGSVLWGPRRLLHGGMLAAWAAHSIGIASHFHWWGGGSMGPRLTADLLPALAIMAGATASRAFDGRHSAHRWFAGFFVAVTLGWSVLVCCGHALSDSYRWERRPIDVDQAPERLLSWRDNFLLEPFRSDATSYEARFPLALLAPKPGATIGPPAVEFRWQAFPGAAAYIVEIAPKAWCMPPYALEPVADPSTTFPIPEKSLDAFTRCNDYGWRVRALDSSGKLIAVSAYRRLTVGPAGRR